jgi:hypothetical protein
MGLSKRKVRAFEPTKPMCQLGRRLRIADRAPTNGSDGKSPTWKSVRRHRLAEEPRCRQCAIEGRIVAASHVDHIESHLGQWLLFFKYENTQSLCAHHRHRHNHPESPRTGYTARAPEATRTVTASYPPAVRAWIKRRGGLTQKVIYLRGRELTTLYPRC